ncbi:hypothetical protein WMY93_020613 [Mugilogobius chulae]|uniref:SHSP domain-containing protein n=1 Tax=Mugilogobius chulae TaxID=88201 RepID=A0AAW0NFF7_9GOBI
MPRPIFRREANWDPFQNWTQPSRVFSQDFGLPPCLEPGDVDWVEWAKKRLASFSWGPNAEGLLSPFSGQHLALNQSDLRQLTGRGSEVTAGQGRWKVQLDVKNFSPEEITVKTKDGYMQISGKHEEKQDEHGTVSRCFTRKYKLPQAWICSRSVVSCFKGSCLEQTNPKGGAVVKEAAVKAEIFPKLSTLIINIITISSRSRSIMGTRDGERFFLPNLKRKRRQEEVKCMCVEYQW